MPQPATKIEEGHVPSLLRDLGEAFKDLDAQLSANEKLVEELKKERLDDDADVKAYKRNVADHLRDMKHLLVFLETVERDYPTPAQWHLDLVELTARARAAHDEATS